MITIKNNSTVSPIPAKERTLPEEVECQILGGSKVFITAYSENGPVTLEIYNTYSTSIPYRLVKTLVTDSDGFIDYELINFHHYIKFKIIPSSTQKCSVGISIKDDGDYGYGSSQEAIDELNRLVPKYYDDAEVLAETPKKQPTMIQFRKDGINIRTIEITYTNEIFKRVRVL